MKMLNINEKSEWDNPKIKWNNLTFKYKLSPNMYIYLYISFNKIVVLEYNFSFTI